METLRRAPRIRSDSLCIPLTVRGATLGLLYLSTRDALTEVQFRELRTLAITVTESITLALSNLKLQEEH